MEPSHESPQEAWHGAWRLLAPEPTTELDATTPATVLAAPAYTVAEPAGVDFVTGLGFSPL